MLCALRMFNLQVDYECFRWLHVLYKSNMQTSWFFFRLQTIDAFHVCNSSFLASCRLLCWICLEAVMLCCPLIIKNIPSLISSQDFGFFWRRSPSSMHGVRQIFCLWLMSPISIRTRFRFWTIFISHARTTTTSCLYFASCATIICLMFTKKVASTPNG